MHSASRSARRPVSSSSSATAPPSSRCIRAGRRIPASPPPARARRDDRSRDLASKGGSAFFRYSREIAKRPTGFATSRKHRPDWHIRDVAFKFHPCCHYLHPFIEAAGELSAKGVRADMIEEIECRVPTGAAGIICEPWPEKQAATGHAMRWSLPAVVAARLADGPIGPRPSRPTPSTQARELAARTLDSRSPRRISRPVSKPNSIAACGAVGCARAGRRCLRQSLPPGDCRGRHGKIPQQSRCRQRGGFR